MYTVYLLKSIKNNWYYVGMSENVERRFKQHNKGRVVSTKAYLPFEIIYTKEFETRVEARDYEKYLKIRCNKERIIESKRKGRNW